MVPVVRRWLPAFGLILLASSSYGITFRIAITDPSVAWAKLRIEALDPAFFDPVVGLIGADVDQRPIHLLIADEASPIARQTPRWIAGFASGADDAIVLLPARAADYPNDGFDELVLHEVTHILVWRAAGGGSVPRWFNEGFAMTAGRSWNFEDRRRLTAAIVTGNPVSLDQIERAFFRGEVPAGRAYALSEALVRDIIRHQGPSVVRRTLGGVSAGDSFDQAFERASAQSLDAVVNDFWRRQTFWNRWVPVVTSGFVLWIVITLLALLAFRRRRARDAAIKQKWEQEEAPADPEPPDEWIN